MDAALPDLRIAQAWQGVTRASETISKFSYPSGREERWGLPRATGSSDVEPNQKVPRGQLPTAALQVAQLAVVCEEAALLLVGQVVVAAAGEQHRLIGGCQPKRGARP